MVGKGYCGMGKFFDSSWFANGKGNKDVRNESDALNFADLLSCSRRESTALRMGFAVAASGGMTIDRSHPSSYALITNWGGHPELQLLVSHICRLKILVLPVR